MEIVKIYFLNMIIASTSFSCTSIVAFSIYQLEMIHFNTVKHRTKKKRSALFKAVQVKLVFQQTVLRAIFIVSQEPGARVSSSFVIQEAQGVFTRMILTENREVCEHLLWHTWVRTGL